MEKPAATLRHYLTSVTRIFRGEHEGLRQLGAAGRAVPRAAPQIPVYVGGVASQSLAVTSELADRSFVTQCAPQGLPEIREGLVRGARRAGRALADIPIAPLVHCCVCPDQAVALRSVRRVLAFYGQVPLYNRFFARQGFAWEAEQIAAAAARGDKQDREGGVRGNGKGEPVNLAQIDLNLLVALNTLLTERNVTRALARELIVPIKNILPMRKISDFTASPSTSLKQMRP